MAVAATAGPALPTHVSRTDRDSLATLVGEIAGEPPNIVVGKPPDLPRHDRMTAPAAGVG